MRILALDTTMGACSAALLGQEGIIAFRHRILARGHAEAVTPMIAEIFAEAKTSMEDVDRIGVTLGPGTFTGVRVGIASARALAIGTDTPIGAVSSLQAIAANAVENLSQEDETNTPIAVISDARRSEVYFQLFDSQAKAVTEPAVLAPERVADHLSANSKANQHMVLIGTGTGIMKSKLDQRGIVHRSLEGVSPFPDARCVAKLVSNLPKTALGVPSPLYLRAPDAKLPTK